MKSIKIKCKERLYFGDCIQVNGVLAIIASDPIDLGDDTYELSIKCDHPCEKTVTST